LTTALIDSNMPGRTWAWQNVGQTSPLDEEPIAGAVVFPLPYTGPPV